MGRLLQFKEASTAHSERLREVQRPSEFRSRDLDQKRSPAQQQLVKQYFQGYIPHVVVLDKSGKAVYNSSGEVDESPLSSLLDNALE